jgi:hypothetical protein
VRTWLRENSLTLFFLALFAAAVVGQAFAGHADFNNQLLAASLEPVSLGRYVTSSQYAVDLAENWQSEYLQFLLYIVATVWLVQKGSTESKPLGEEGHETDKDQRVRDHATKDSPQLAESDGVRLWLFSYSLALVMGVIFALSWLAQSVAGRVAYNTERLAQLQTPLSWPAYVSSADFWNRTLQNWQSEFLAVASMAIFSVYLRHRGSSQSKPVGTPHDTTGAEG